ncbi:MULTISPECIES: exodeoxyribonuclease VII small subunit [Clostridium]|uniref:exodeoxyribonuclease VII small subunit n=1 Tax=Clostridium TaxID=1485 RepID=UPI00082595BA|nr:MULTISPECIES: exodeoxyribonuclease VII small subunit [Clostridium]PJI09940.1 exodeoxyribonuclease VII small subunit [Clostridium sp. CT7]
MPKKESYETMMKELENIVSSMENEELTLDDTMKNYEDGVKLCNKLYKILNKAEGKIKILTQEGEEDFNKAGDLNEQ